MKITSVQPSYKMSYQDESTNKKSKKTIEEKYKSKEIIDYRQLSDDEAKNLYYSLKENNLMKSKIEILVNNEDNELDYSDIKELQEIQNKIKLAEYSANNTELKTTEIQFQIWA